MAFGTMSWVNAVGHVKRLELLSSRNAIWSSTPGLAATFRAMARQVKAALNTMIR